jgi:hypothetical protein
MWLSAFHQVGSNVAHWTPNVERNRLKFTRNVLLKRVACDYLSSFIFFKKNHGTETSGNRLLVRASLVRLWLHSTLPVEATVHILFNSGCSSICHPRSCQEPVKTENFKAGARRIVTNNTALVNYA